MTSNTPVGRYLLTLATVLSVDLARRQPGAQPGRPQLDGGPRHGHRRRRDRHPGGALQAPGVRRQLVLPRRRRRAVGLRLPGHRRAPAASISTARSRSCSSSLSAAWAASPATSSARRSSACCRSCSATPGRRLFGGSVDAGQLQNLQKIIFGVLIIVFLIKEPEGLIRLLAQPS